MRTFSPPLAKTMGPEPGPISVDLRRHLQRSYEQGVRLLREKRHDEAHVHFSEAIRNDPGNLLYVEAFLENLQRKYPNNKKGSFFKGMRVKSALKIAAASRKWPKVFALGPHVLKSNPWNVSALRALAHACEHFGYHEVELRYLHFALQAKPEDSDVLRHFALFLARRGQFEQAIDCWRKIEKIKEGDQEASSMIENLTLQKTSRQNVTENHSISSKESAPEKNLASVRQQLEQTIAADPTDLESYHTLASLLLDQGLYAEAEELLGKAFTASGGDFSIRTQLENTQILYAQHKITIAEKRSQTHQTEEASQLVMRLKMDLNRLQLDIYQNREILYPNDPEIQFQLGIFLKQAENYTEAIKYFSKSTQDNKHKALSELELGECSQHLRQFRKSLTHYQQSIQHNQRSDSPQYHLALYRAGILALGLKSPDLAEQYLSELATLSPSYKDVASRLDKLRQIRDKE